MTGPVFRRIQLVMAPTGRKLFIDINPKTPPIDVLITEGDVIHLDEIRGWFLPLKLIPTDHELEELARNLNIIRVTQIEGALPDPPELKQVVDGLAALAEAGPPLAKFILGIVEAAGPHARARGFHRRITLVNRLGALIVDAQSLREDPWMRPKEQVDKRSWHDDIDLIAFFLENIARRLGEHISLTKDASPGVKFIVRALNRAGSSPPCTGHGVAQAIKRRRKHPLPEYYLESDH